MRSEWSKGSPAAAVLVLLVWGAGAIQTGAQGQSPDATSAARGEYLVNSMGCHDCHTPWKMGPNGPEPEVPLGRQPSREPDAGPGDRTGPVDRAAVRADDSHRPSPGPRPGDPAADALA